MNVSHEQARKISLALRSVELTAMQSRILEQSLAQAQPEPERRRRQVLKQPRPAIAIFARIWLAIAPSALSQKAPSGARAQPPVTGHARAN